eukprot:5820544-Prymnesium_polylepis.2
MFQSCECVFLVAELAPCAVISKFQAEPAGLARAKSVTRLLRRTCGAPSGGKASLNLLAAAAMIGSMSVGMPSPTRT